MMVLCAAAAQAGRDGPNNPSFLLFAGTDLWRDGAFVDGGLLWSPAGLDTGPYAQDPSQRRPLHLSLRRIAHGC